MHRLPCCENVNLTAGELDVASFDDDFTVEMPFFMQIGQICLPSPNSEEREKLAWVLIWMH